MQEREEIHDKVIFDWVRLELVILFNILTFIQAYSEIHNKMIPGTLWWFFKPLFSSPFPSFIKT